MRRSNHRVFKTGDIVKIDPERVFMPYSARNTLFYIHSKQKSNYNNRYEYEVRTLADGTGWDNIDRFSAFVGTADILNKLKLEEYAEDK